MKALAVLLYGMGGMSFSMTGRVLGVSDVAVLKWVRAEAAALPEPEVLASVVTVEVDEMWHRNVSTALIQPGLEFRLGWSGRLCGIELSEAAGFLV